MNRRGVADIVILVGMAIVGLVTLCGRHGITTRSVVTTINVEARGTNITTTVFVDGQRVEVSGSGGVSIPLQEAK